MTETMLATEASYLYGIVAADGFDSNVLDGIPTVAPDRTARLVGTGSIAAIVSDVSLAEFGEAELPSRLNDALWLERAARAHEAVLEAALAATSVVPFRFCTIYRTDAAVQDYLEGNGAALEALLERLHGSVELGVKGFVDDGPLNEALRRRSDHESPAETSQGRAYLVRRQAERRLDEERRRFTAECAKAVHHRLTAAARDARANPVQPRELSGRDDEMFLNAAYLVPRDEPSFRRELERIEREYALFGFSFEVTGPWPPYNFVPSAEEVS